MDEIEPLMKELARVVVKRQMPLSPVLRYIRVQACLRACREWGNTVYAARVLGVSRSTLWRLRRGSPVSSWGWELAGIWTVAWVWGRPLKLLPRPMRVWTYTLGLILAGIVGLSHV
jgi:hypothetical protein